MRTLTRPSAVASPPSAVSWVVHEAHPGAGGDIVVELLQLAGDSATVDTGWGLPLMVCRSTAASTAAAATLLTRYGGRPALVVLADIPAPLPRAVTYRLQVMRDEVMCVVHVPYLWPLRDADSVSDVATRRSISRAARSLHNTLSKERPR